MTIRVAQESHYQGRDRWKWSVWLEGTRAELDNVEAVTYILHSTFAHPIRTVSDRATNFRLDASGWGEFDIKLEIHRRNGRPLERRHHLQLEYPTGKAPPPNRSARAQTKRNPMPDAATTGEQSYRVFISHSALDRPLVNELAGFLAADDVEVFDDSDVDPGLPFRVAIEQAMADADAAVVILSDFESDLISSEVKTAQGLGMPVFSVNVDKSAVPAGFFGETAAFEVDAGSDMSQLASRIADHLRSMG